MTKRAKQRISRHHKHQHQRHHQQEDRAEDDARSPTPTAWPKPPAHQVRASARIRRGPNAPNAASPRKRTWLPREGR
jgi:hypothetical protein